MKNFAFSLIELMVVIAIVALLAAIALPAYQNYLTSTKVSAGMQFLAGQIQAAQIFYQKNGYFPNVVQLGFPAGSDATSTPYEGDPSNYIAPYVADFSAQDSGTVGTKCHQGIIGVTLSNVYNGPTNSSFSTGSVVVVDYTLTDINGTITPLCASYAVQYAPTISYLNIPVPNCYTDTTQFSNDLAAITAECQ